MGDSSDSDANNDVEATPRADDNSSSVEEDEEDTDEVVRNN